MKLGIQNSSGIVGIEKNCITFNNNKLNSIQNDDAKNYRILHRVV
jgi:hypothetical protein